MIIHVPHSSVFIPPEYAQEFVLSEKEMTAELLFSTDFDTDKMFEASPQRVLHIAEVSRLVCDVERFLDDHQEAMAAVGRGAVYTKTSGGKQLRYLTAEVREEIIQRYYVPHHAGLTAKVAAELEQRGRALLIDLHAFHQDNTKNPAAACKVEICLGTDSFHTPDALLQTVKSHVEACGYRTAINVPFSGTLVPMAFYRTDARVRSIMLEINRRVYFADEGKMNRLKEMLSSLADNLLAAGW